MNLKILFAPITFPFALIEAYFNEGRSKIGDWTVDRKPGDCDIRSDVGGLFQSRKAAYEEAKCANRLDWFPPFKP